jgi:hypothetical protein
MLTPRLKILSLISKTFILSNFMSPVLPKASYLVLTLSGQIEMPIVFCDGLSLSGLTGHLNCYQTNTQRSAYGMVGHLPLHFNDKHVVSLDDNAKLI